MLNIKMKLNPKYKDQFFGYTSNLKVIKKVVNKETCSFLITILILLFILFVRIKI